MMKHILYNSKQRSFIVTSSTIDSFKGIQKDLTRRDLENYGAYMNAELMLKIKEKSTETLEKYSSVACRNLLLEFYINTDFSMSLMNAVGLSEKRFFDAINIAVVEYETILINENGGFCEISYSDEEYPEFNTYDWVDSNIVDNKTAHLILENSHTVEPSLLDRIESNVAPSVITNFKHILGSESIDCFLRSRTDWSLWVYTQGSDSELYISFLNKYSSYISKIYVYSSNAKIIATLAKAYPSISFTDI